MEVVADDLVCFVVDLFARDGGLPRSLEAGLARRVDLMFSGQTQQSLKAFEREAHLRAMIGKVGARLPAELRQDPEIAAALGEGRASRATVLHLSYRAPDEEAGFEKPFDLSHTSMADRWRAGARDMAEALRALAEVREDGGQRAPGATVHRIRC